MTEQSKIKPVSITMNYFDGEERDATAMRFIRAILDNCLSGDNMAQTRVLQYLEQKIQDRIMEENTISMQPIGQLAHTPTEMRGEDK